MDGQAGQADGAQLLGLRWDSTPRSRVRLTNRVVESVADQILGGQLPPETLLPSEAVMGESFGVSRTVIRESLKVLENMGLILKRQGKLSWTAPHKSWDLLDPIVLASRLRHDPDLSFLDDLVTVRAALESEMAGQAADRAGDEEVAEIAARLAQLADHLAYPEAYKASDADFHAAVMRASHNDMATTIVAAIQSKAKASAQYAATGTPPGLIHLSQKGHVEVLAAIRGRDAAGAAQAMREHIRSAWAWRQNEPVAEQRRRRLGLQRAGHGSDARSDVPL
jgi:DNA-binding FadR family transcriptional regulator